MIKSDETKELTAALVKVQAQMQPATKDKDNPFYSKGAKKAKFADLPAMVEVSRQLLTDNGLAVITTTFPTGVPNTIGIESTLLHDSGQYIGGQLVMPLSKNDPQGVAAAITYGTRVLYAGNIGLAVTDDDGESATDRSKKKPAPDVLSEEQIAEVEGLMEKLGITRPELDEIISAKSGKKMTLYQVSPKNFDGLVKHLKELGVPA